MWKWWRRTSVLLAIACASAAFTCVGGSAWAQTPEPLSGFVPIEQVPRADQLPAAPLLISAYAFIWVAVMVYIWTLWIRMGRVEADIRALQRDR